MADTITAEFTSKEIALFLQCLYKSQKETSEFLELVKFAMGDDVKATAIIDTYCTKRLDLINETINKLEAIKG
jgi:hypothetical protein